MRGVKGKARFCGLAVAYLLAGQALAGTSAAEVPSPSRHADTEASTNVAFNVGSAVGRVFTLSLDLNAAANNSVSVAFGADANLDGVLAREEIDVMLGWDSGSWFYRDRVSGTAAGEDRASGRRRLDWTLTTDSRKAVRTVAAADDDGPVFAGGIADARFDAAWNLMQVTARGLSETDGMVVGRVSGIGFSVSLR